METLQMQYSTNPTSKADLVDRLLSQAFTGDLREIAKDPVKVTRPKPHVVKLEVAGKAFLLAVHKPKPEEARLKAKQRWAARRGNKGVASPKPAEKGTAGRYSS